MSTFTQPVSVPHLSGERFQVTYRIQGKDAPARAAALCIEQTVEFPADLLPAGDIPNHIVGHIESLTSTAPDVHHALISYPVEIAGTDLPQLLNVIFGNSSIKAGIRVERLDLPDSLLAHYRGPRYGVAGLRDLVGAEERPLLCTALKPMGLAPQALADLAYQFALGGIDLIKDDHGLADQAFCPYEERVARCAEAVTKANAETGRHCLYMPNLAGPFHLLESRAHYAKDAGAGGLMVCPGLLGMDTMRHLADDDRLALPIASHPALQGSFVVNADSGFAHAAWYGQLMRLAGADAVIFPNYGGRFGFSRDECAQIAEGCRLPMGHLKPSLPAPGGGMTLDRIPDMQRLYGDSVIYLIGGDLHRHEDGLVASARRFAASIGKS